jgi:hypothetical protein
MGFSVTSLQRSRADHLTKLTKEFASNEASGYAKDERYWQPEADKIGKGEAVIRFLPGIDDEPAMVKLYHHGFHHGDKNWYIENSRTTINDKEPDPCAEEFWRVRGTGKSVTDESKVKASKFGRKLSYISNILVVDDPAHPENNGKVFLFKYGKVIYDMIKDAFEPKFEGVDPIDAFDIHEGANFHIRFYKKDIFRKYDKSEFQKPAPIAKSEKAIISMLDGKGWSLRAEVALDKFKSYEELRRRFNKVMGRDDVEQTEKPKTTAKNTRVQAEEEDEGLPWEEPKAAKPKTATKKTESDDDELDAFSSMADED